MKTNILRPLLAIMIVALMAQLEGCAFAVGAAVGAAAGYTLKSKGYQVRAPVVQPGK